MRIRHLQAFVARAAILVTAIVVGGGVAVVSNPPARSSASVGTVSFTTSPSLYPAFDPSISDYVIRCTPGIPVQVSISNSDGADTSTTVSVAGQSAQTPPIVASVNLTYGQEFSVDVMQGATTKQYFIRCLPSDFPTWTADRSGTPQAEYYVVSPALNSNPGNRYITIYDTNGVPLWWFLPPNGRKAIDAKLAPDGDVLWTEQDNVTRITLNAQERGLDGSVVDDSIVPDGYQPDEHEIQQLPNGDYLLIGNYARCCYDLSSYGGSDSATVLDNVIQEVTPAGSAVWTWDAADHIGVDEVVPQWWATIVSFGQLGLPYDVFHMNSVEADAGGNLLVSLRYEGVYKVTNPASPTDPGKVVWKLGGSPSSVAPGTQLTIIGDPVFDAGSGFGGQHYARYYDAGDGNLYVTLHDNGTDLDRPPRGVRYQIDETAKTATLVEDVRDTADPDFRSICCGSAKELPGGDWVMSWGFGDLVMELNPAGDRVFALGLDEPSYRADPVLPGVLTRQALRAGMDAQIVDTDADGCPDVREASLTPPTDPNNVWDFYSVPVPALFAATDPTTDFRDSAVRPADAEAVFAYFEAGAKAGTAVYEQDLNGNGIKDGIEYDRSLVSPGISGAPDGMITPGDAQIAFVQFKNGYTC